MVKFQECSWPITSRQLPIICKMYPYSMINYNDVRPSLVRLVRRIARKKLPPDTRVLALAQHNGYGTLWGIVVLFVPGAAYGMLAAHFWNPDTSHSAYAPPQEYDSLVLRGTVPVRYDGPDHRHVPLTLDDFFRQAEGLDTLARMIRSDDERAAP